MTVDQPNLAIRAETEGVKPAGSLQGRRRELVRAIDVMRAARARGGGVLLITGDAGIGKTALLTEVLREMATVGVRTARSKCDEIEQAWAGAPVISLFRSSDTPLLTAADYQEIAH